MCKLVRYHGEKSTSDFRKILGVSDELLRAIGVFSFEEGAKSGEYDSWSMITIILCFSDKLLRPIEA